MRASIAAWALAHGKPSLPPPRIRPRPSRRLGRREPGRSARGPRGGPPRGFRAPGPGGRSPALQNRRTARAELRSREQARRSPRPSLARKVAGHRRHRALPGPRLRAAPGAGSSEPRREVGRTRSVRTASAQRVAGKGPPTPTSRPATSRSAAAGWKLRAAPRRLRASPALSAADWGRERRRGRGPPHPTPTAPRAPRSGSAGRRSSHGVRCTAES